jgi:hypothetical protein
VQTAAQNSQIRAAHLEIVNQPTAASDNGGYTRDRRTEGLLRSVIGAVVQGARRRENPP